MPIPDAAHLNFIETEIRSYWETSRGKPIYLAELGSRFTKRFQSIRKLYDESLRDLIENHLGDKIVVVAHPEISQRVAAAPIENREEAANAVINFSTHRGSSSDELDVFRVQNAVIFAFQQKLGPNEKVFLRVARPFHFTVSCNNPDIKNYYEIDRVADFAYPRPRKVSELEHHEISVLKNIIQDWLSSRSIPFSNVYFDRPAKAEKRQDIEKSLRGPAATESALTRLLQSQPDELRKKIVIPLDIAELLSRN